ncbi:MAG: carboxymuconolactone decarboxylase family protein [Bryobacterales bacterium]|nr:carboxymuconolactone decarboxylase family protein [Bryobacterales bacterium]
MSSELGVSDEKILALPEYATSPHYSPAERVALRYADAITLSDRDVDDALFAELRAHYDEEQILELTASIAWENASSKFNRALRIPSQELWKRKQSPDGE